ncbi:hypothetical protein K469DRAFT_752715 [Zopfia rhizophila CBS 207.26]|uniref:Uncharacterized protein n=1 Tax=Zopfia rhizophila CBS 207.26 TaxID=1314779 RepID=A0A6A6DQS9_9PEZI|nr:hypothetical protein K469DRAFT_752715 [Zopfia rhizophila CBS 207.26]
MAQRVPQTPPLLGSAQATASTAEVDKLFNNAKSNFLATLTPQERDQFSACRSTDQLLSDITALEHMRKSRRALPFLRRIKGFSDHLSPYFKVIEIVCQAHPEWACSAWGAFRLVLQLASNFTTFFEKLSKLIERLTASLPQYAEFYQTLYSGRKRFSPRLSNSLVRFYVDMLEFFQAIARVFSRPNGKLKRSPIVIADLLWQPFDIRFQDLLERMAFHQGVLKDELQWAGMENLRSIFEAGAKRADDARFDARRSTNLLENIQNTLSEETQRAFRTSIVAWLAPPSFKDNFEKAQDSREEGTAEWLFDEPKFKAWESSRVESITGHKCLSDAVLWIRGNPGWGKTVVAASTVDELESKRSESGGEPIVCYYFFNQQDPLKSSSTRLGAYRAIATQIFEKCHKLEEIHNIYALANDGSKPSASEHELRDLLEMVIPLLSNLYLVLDGIDECTDIAKLTSDIRRFCDISLVKIILFSRPHVAPLRRLLESERIITLSRTVMSEDIRVFLHHQIEVLRDYNCFSSDANLLSIEDEIVKRADGMFLWARLMICYLDSPALTKSERITTIFKTTPVGLQEMYARIFGQIRLMDDASQQLAASVFTWITYTQENLTVEGCSDAVYPAVGADDESEKKDYVDHAVIVDGLIALLDGDATPTRLEKFRYVIELLEKFLEFPLNIIVWIEAIYLFTKGSPIHSINSIPDLLWKFEEALLDPISFKAADHLSSFAFDLREIDHDWKETVVHAPHEIWNEVSSFNPSRFLAQNSGISVENLAPSRQDHQSKCMEPLFCISASNGDCSLIGKLTIWPSSIFNKLWRSKPTSYDEYWHQLFCGDDIDQQKYCGGWIAHHEIRTLDTVFLSAFGDEMLEIQVSLGDKPGSAYNRHLADHYHIRPLLFTGGWTATTFFNRARAGSFSDSRFAVFRDWDMEKYYGSFAVFRITCSSFGLETSLVKYQEFDGCINGDGLRICAIYLCKQEILLLDKDKLVFINLESGEEFFTNVSKSVGISNPEFSQCGKYYILHRDSCRPEIHPLPYDSPIVGTSEEQQSRGYPVTKRRKLENSIQRLFDGTVSKSADALRIMDSSFSIVDCQTKTFIGISPAYDDGPRRIELINQHVDRDEASSCTLVKIPQNTNIRNISTTLKMPDDDSRQLRIVLNPEAQSTYESDTPTASKHLPAVIDRDLARSYRSGPGPATPELAQALWSVET